jgi:8-amino-7-oxononanoate synthase
MSSDAVSIEVLLRRSGRVLDGREAEGTLRRLSARAEHSPLINLADNDYLGLARDPAVVAAAREALGRWGASASASPLVTGYTELHEALEGALARWHGFSCGLVWNSGHAANTAVLGTLARRGDRVLADRLVHNSMIGGILKSGARLQRYRHCDLDHLEMLLGEGRPPDAGGVTFVVTESVFSMDGDAPDMVRLAALRARHGFVLVVDEAHAVGWFGPAGAGLAEAAGVSGQVDIFVGTLGKALGAQGAYTLFRDARLRSHLLNLAGEFVYSTYLAPACAAAALAAVRRVGEMSAGERAALPALSRRWREELRGIVPGVPGGESPIVPVPLGSGEETMRCAAALRGEGFLVGAIRPPTVPSGGARLRVSLRRGLGGDVLARFGGALRASLPGRAVEGGTRRRAVLFVGGWGVSPGAQHALLAARWPEHEWTVTPPVRRSVVALLGARCWDALGGYSLGAWLLSDVLARLPAGAGLPSCALVCPFPAFPAEAGCGGRVGMARVRYLARWLRRDARGALVDFYQRAGLSFGLDAVALPYALEDLLEGLESLCAMAPVVFPSGARLVGGGADALLDNAVIKDAFPALEIRAGAGHDLGDFMASGLGAFFP